MAYAQVDPFGNDQTLSDAHFANLMALTANISRDPKKGRAYKPEDFLLLKTGDRQVEKVQKSPQEVYAGFRAMAKATQKGIPKGKGSE